MLDTCMGREQLCSYGFEYMCAYLQHNHFLDLIVSKRFYNRKLSLARREDFGFVELIYLDHRSAYRKFFWVRQHMENLRVGDYCLVNYCVQIISTSDTTRSEIIISYNLVLHTPTHCLQNIGYSFEWVQGTIHMLRDQRPEEVSSQFMYLLYPYY